MERPRVADGEDSLNIWAEAREGKVFRLWGVNGANNSLLKKKHVLQGL